MAEKAKTVAKSVAGTVWKMIRKVVKKPWEFTGPTSHPEYLEANPKSTEYRRFSPATPEVKPSIPRTVPEHIFDIKYYPRDHRRRAPVHKVDWEYDPHNPEHRQFMKDFIDKMPLPRWWVLGQKRDIDDEYRADGGYQWGGSKQKAAMEAASKAQAEAQLASASGNK